MYTVCDSKMEVICSRPCLYLAKEHAKNLRSMFPVSGVIWVCGPDGLIIAGY